MNYSLSSMMVSPLSTIVVIATTLLSLSSSVAIVNAEKLAVGDNICVEGFVMDFFCINRGTLLDAPDVVTLQDPQLHSLHCLIDVPSCVSTDFNVLLNPTETGDGMYRRGFVLDEPSKANAITLAKANGSCDDCDNGTNESLGRTLGFRVVMNAIVTDLREDDDDSPPIIQVNGMEDVTADFDSTTGTSTSTTGTSACETFFQMEDILTKNPALLDAFVPAASTGRSQLLKMYLAHGSLMLIGWGLLLPAGAIIARFLKHRPNGLWYRIHRKLQVIGLMIVLIGFIIALTQFNVFGDVGLVQYNHGVCGVVVMILGLLQPINAILRPHAPEDGEEKTTLRVAWEYYHKGSGWFAVLLAIPTIVLGTKSLPNSEYMQIYQITYGVGCWGCLLLLIGFIFYDKKTYVKEEEEEAAPLAVPVKKDVDVAEQAELAA